MRPSRHVRAVALVLGFVVSALGSGAARADEVTDWQEHTLAALGTAGTSPLVSTREAALVSAAVFDAVNGVERRYEPIHVAPDAPRGASKRAAAVQAAYAILVARFPAQSGDLATKRAASLSALGTGESVDRGVEWGQDVADAILSWRSSDGFAPPPPAFLGGNDAGQWRPTPPANLPGAGPQFATMTPWGIESPDQFRPAGPPAMDGAEYLAEFDEVKEMGSVDSDARTEDQTDAALFWHGTTATYLWNRAALDLVEGTDAELSDNAHLFATLNVAVADGIIACWDSKYHFEFWRPITAVRLADTDGNPDTVEDTGWTPLVVTPAFPEYVSGHSSASSAAATVLAAAFGDETDFTLRSQANAGWTRSFSSFAEALAEVADARIHAGIHFRSACEDGVEVGTAVATYVLENRMARVHGNGD